MQTERQYGEIAMYNPSRGYGFIRRAGALDMFFHVRQFCGEEAALVSGARVSFVLDTDGRSGRPCAVAVEMA